MHHDQYQTEEHQDDQDGRDQEAGDLIHLTKVLGDAFVPDGTLHEELSLTELTGIFSDFSFSEQPGLEAVLMHEAHGPGTTAASAQ